MSQKLPVNDFKQVEETSQFNKYSIKKYNDDSKEGCFIEADVQHTEDLHNLHNDLTFFLERTIITKMEKFVANFHDKEEYVIRIRNSKSRLNHGLVLKKIHGNIKFNQKA